MYKALYITIVGTIILALSLPFPSLIHAQGSTPANTPPAAGGATSFDFKSYDLIGCEGKIECLVNKVIDSLLLLGIPLVVLAVLVGGIYIATAGGNSKRLETGKDYILNAVYGYAILLLAKGVYLVIESVLGVKK